MEWRTEKEGAVMSVSISPCEGVEEWSGGPRKKGLS